MDERFASQLIAEVDDRDHDDRTARLVELTDLLPAATLHHARLVAEREALAAVIPVDPGYAHPNAEARVRHLEHELEDLDRGEGWGVWRGTPVGDAAIAWSKAANEQRSCLARARGAGFREGRQLRRQAERAAEREGPLREDFQRKAAPERARIAAELPEVRKLSNELSDQFAASVHFKVAHPEALRRLESLGNDIACAAYEMDLERQGIDGVEAQPPQLRQPARGLERHAPELDRGIDLGIGV